MPDERALPSAVELAALRWRIAEVLTYRPGSDIKKPSLHYCQSLLDVCLGYLDTERAARVAAEGALEERQDWHGDDVADAVGRIREQSQLKAQVVSVQSADLRKLLASADGLADSYSQVLEHICGLTKPTTDPQIAIAMADDKHTEWVNMCIEEALEDCTCGLTTPPDATNPGDILALADEIRERGIVNPDGGELT